jgi:thiol-disulfide isomerase/thioredoxin
VWIGVWIGAPGAVPAGELTPLADRGAPELSAPALDGSRWRLTDRRGQVVLVNFWAGWCSSCLSELPALNRLGARLAGRPLVVVGVNVGEPQRRVRTLAAQHGIGFPVLLDPEQAAFRRWGVTVLPTTYVLDAQGRLRLTGVGSLDWDDPAVTAPLAALIDEAAPATRGAPDLGVDDARRRPQPNQTSP